MASTEATIPVDGDDLQQPSRPRDAETGERSLAIISPIAQSQPRRFESKPAEIESDAAPAITIPWFLENHIHDRTEKTASLGALVIADGVPYGFPIPSSDFRWVPTLLSMYPTFIINVRQDHLVGEELEKHREKMRSRKITGLTRNGLDVLSFTDNYVEYTYEFDLDTIKEFQIRPCSEEDLRELHNHCPALSGTEFGLVKFKKVVEPLRMKKQPQTFSVGSKQAQFVDAMAGHTDFVIFVDTQKQCGKAFMVYADTCVAGRYYAINASPRNDWFFSRFESYGKNAASPFVQYIQDNTNCLPVVPWLKTDDLSKSGTVYPLRASGVPRARFPREESYTQHFVAALLYERDEIARQQHALFNTTNIFPATAVMIIPSRFRISIKLSGKAVLGHTSCIRKIIPSARTSVTLCLLEMSPIDEEITGKVSSFTQRGFDFTVEATLPASLQKRQPSVTAADLTQFHVLWEGSDQGNLRKIKAVQDAASHASQKEPGHGLIQRDNQLRGGFCLRNIIIDAPRAYQSRDLPAHSAQDHQCRDPKAKDILESSLGTATGLTQEQRLFVHKALSGTHLSVLILEGFPGSGKSFTLAALVVSLLKIGYRLIITSQSNQGVDALFERVIRELIKRGDEELADACVRMRCETDETDLANEFYNNLQQKTEKTALSKADPIVKTYRAYLAARRNEERTMLEPSWKEVLIILRKKILERAKLVACTAFVSGNIVGGNLEDAKFSADVVIFDEAGQATDPDRMMAVTPWTANLSLLVLAGDTKQLGPVVRSEVNNIYGNILSTSAMQRVKEDPDITCMELTHNFRGPPSTWQMSNAVFYDGRMQCGGDPARWDQTPLTQAMMTMLNAPALYNAFRRPDLAFIPTNRQFFFQVGGKPQQEENGTSWWNPSGVEAVVSFAKHLISTGTATLEDIGIISMYSEDVRRIQERLAANGLTVADEEHSGIKAATVHSFQGGQKKIILLHFVAAFDEPHNPFKSVKDPRRLNVATTRSEEFQFLFGNLDFWMHQKRVHAETGKKKTTDDINKMYKVCSYIHENGQIVD